MLALVPFPTTESICLKLPHSSVRIPPNGASIDLISRSVQSTASNAQRWVISASSTLIALQSMIPLASTVPFLMLHIGSSCLCVSRRISNLECGVQPPDSSITTWRCGKSNLFLWSNCCQHSDNQKRLPSSSWHIKEENSTCKVKEGTINTV